VGAVEGAVLNVRHEDRFEWKIANGQVVESYLTSSSLGIPNPAGSSGA